jgi:hypothetical protein
LPPSPSHPCAPWSLGVAISVLACTYTPALPPTESGRPATPAASDAAGSETVRDAAVGAPPVDALRPDLRDAASPDPRDTATPDLPDAAAPDSRETAPPPPPDAASPERACQPVPEVCNGLDEDCDGVPDDGCPVDGALLRTDPLPPPSPVLGSLSLPRAMTFTDSCPAGQVIVGFTGNYGSGIDSLGIRCGQMQVREDRSVRPYRYQVGVAPGASFPPRGGTGGLANGVDARMRCPPGEVVVGLSAWLDPDAASVCPANYCPFTGALCPSVYGLTVSCAAHDLLGGPGNFRIARRGAAQTPGERIGAVGGVGEVENPYACPAGAMMREMTSSIGIWPLDCINTVVNGLQLACTSPTLALRPPP